MTRADLWGVPYSREPNPLHDTLVPYLLREVETDNGLCMDFFGESVARLEEDDTIVPLFTKAMADISSKLATMSMNDDYKACVNVSWRLDRGDLLLLTLPGPLDILEVSASSQRPGTAPVLPDGAVSTGHREKHHPWALL